MSPLCKKLHSNVVKLGGEDGVYYACKFVLCSITSRGSSIQKLIWVRLKREHAIDTMIYVCFENIVCILLDLFIIQQ